MKSSAVKTVEPRRKRRLPLKATGLGIDLRLSFASATNHRSRLLCHKTVGSRLSRVSGSTSISGRTYFSTLPRKSDFSVGLEREPRPRIDFARHAAFTPLHRPNRATRLQFLPPPAFAREAT